MPAADGFISSRAHFYVCPPSHHKSKWEISQCRYVASRKFPKMHQEIINEGAYSPKQVFNVDYIGL